MDYYHPAQGHGADPATPADTPDLTQQPAQLHPRAQTGTKHARDDSYASSDDSGSHAHELEAAQPSLDEGADELTALTTQTLNADGTPKRPMNAFMIFARKRRPEVSAANVSMRTGDISKILSKEWASMDSSEKQFYQDQAKKLKDVFNVKWPDYVYRRRPNNTKKKRRNPDASYGDGSAGGSPDTHDDLPLSGESTDGRSPTADAHDPALMAGLPFDGLDDPPSYTKYQPDAFRAPSLYGYSPPLAPSYTHGARDPYPRPQRASPEAAYPLSMARHTPSPGSWYDGKPSSWPALATRSPRAWPDQPQGGFFPQAPAQFFGAHGRAASAPEQQQAPPAYFATQTQSQGQGQSQTQPGISSVAQAQGDAYLAHSPVYAPEQPEHQFAQPQHQHQQHQHQGHQGQTQHGQAQHGSGTRALAPVLTPLATSTYALNPPLASPTHDSPASGHFRTQTSPSQLAGFWGGARRYDER